MDFASIIRSVGRGATGARDLSRSDAQQLYGAMLDGEVPDLELGAIAIALRMKTETVEEMGGFLAAANARLPILRRPPCGKIRPVVIPTYNGARRHANLTPLLALLLQRFDVPVLLHGLSDDYGRVTSEQILCAYGLQACGSVQEAQCLIDQRRMAYLPLPLLSPGLDRLLALRSRLGLRNSAHSLVKAEHDSLRNLPQLPENCDATATVAWMHRVLVGEVSLPLPIANQLACCLHACGRASSFHQAKALVAVAGKGLATV